MKDEEVAKNSVIKAGDGRGFIIEAEGKSYVVTAAHCLPHYTSYLEERTFPNFLDSLPTDDPTVWAECLFADPVADIAVLGAPDGQVLYDECEAFEELMDREPMPVRPAPDECDAWLLTLDGRWSPCQVERKRFALWIMNAVDGIEGGMSGSPIVTDDGAAIGVVCIGSGLVKPTEGGPNPSLGANLPGWLLRDLGLI